MPRESLIKEWQGLTYVYEKQLKLSTQLILYSCQNIFELNNKKRALLQ